MEYKKRRFNENTEILKFSEKHSKHFPKIPQISKKPFQHFQKHSKNFPQNISKTM